MAVDFRMGRGVSSATSMKPRTMATMGMIGALTMSWMQIMSELAGLNMVSVDEDAYKMRETY